LLAKSEGNGGFPPSGMTITRAPEYSIGWHRATLRLGLVHHCHFYRRQLLHSGQTTRGRPTRCLCRRLLFSVLVVIIRVLGKWCKPEIGTVMNVYKILKFKD